MIRRLGFFVAGAAFAIGLTVSGMTDPGKIQGFLDFAGAWDPSLALVMLGAVVGYGGLRRLVLRREQPLLGGNFSMPGHEHIDARLLAGASIFGLGWGLAGLCPGPALTNLGAGRPLVLAFVVAMTAGVLLAQRGFGADS